MTRETDSRAIHGGFRGMPKGAQWRRIAAALLATAALVAGCLVEVAALAHHPGSHARREGGERVRLEAAATASDGCTFIGAVSAGAPAGYRPAPDAFPVTVRLRRPAEARVCTTQVRALRDESLLTVPASYRRLHLFVLKPDGALQATERVSID